MTGSRDLSTIVYASRAVEPMDEAALVDLLQGARGRNADLGITGLLIYAYGSFMQQIEGPVDAVEAVYRSIEQDHRHTAIRLLARRPTTARKFDGWSMGFEHRDEQSLAAALPGFRAPVSYPLLSAELVADTDVAEALLDIFVADH